MPRVRKIKKNPSPYKNFYLVDACFLVNRYLPLKAAPALERTRISKCREWWNEISKQIRKGRARVYIPDICIAESFKVLAKKYYSKDPNNKLFKTAVELNNARDKLRKDVSIPSKTLRAFNRQIRFHDIPTTRDLIISVDRFYELFIKNKKEVSLPDLILLACAKFLMDFYDLPKEYLHIITLDKPLWEGSKKIQELPRAYCPTETKDSFARVFI